MGGGDVKNYLDLRELTSFERGLLELANTETEGVIYAPIDQGPTSEAPSFEPVPNAEILTEGEIRAFMRNPAFVLPNGDDVFRAFDILQAQVPHVYYDELYRQRSSISLERVQGVCAKLQEKLDEISRCLGDETRHPCDASFFPLHYYQIDQGRRFGKDWLNDFGTDAVLAFGLFEAAQSRAFQRYGCRREHWQVANFNRLYPKFLEELGRVLADSALQRRFVSAEVADPLGPSHASRPELSDGAGTTVVRRRHYSYWNLIRQLEEFVGDTRTPDQCAARLRDSAGFLASIDELELPDALKAKVRLLARELAQARSVGDAHFREVMRLQAEIADETSDNGFYFKLSPNYQTRDYEYADVGLIKARTILGWTVVRGSIDHQEHYKTSAGVRKVNFLDRLLDRESEALLDEAKGNSFSIMKRSGVDLDSLMRSYHFGETGVNGRGNGSIVVNYEAAKAHLERFENIFGPSRLGTVLIADDWLDPLWSELRDRFSLEQLIDIKADSTAGHELEHAWRLASGLPHDEESAMYGNAQFAGRPYEALFLLFLSQTNFDEYSLKFSRNDESDLTRLQLAAEKRGIPYERGSGSPDSWISRVKSAIRLGFNSNGDGELAQHARAVKELLISLALQYGVDGPYDNDGLAWVKTLFEKIRTATSHPDVNDSLLRRRIAVAYRERFGRELKPVAQLRPVLEVEFPD